MAGASYPTLTRDALTLTVAGVLAGLGVAVAVFSGFHVATIIIYLVVAGLILLGAAYIRERDPGEPPDQ